MSCCRPPRPIKYVVTDTGDAFEIDWAIYEHAYLYKNKLAFESGTAGLALGEPELPEGLPHEDEFFGKQDIYRDFFFVTIPYTVEGDRPCDGGPDHQESGL